jgi:hypothetical protein
MTSNIGARQLKILVPVLALLLLQEYKMKMKQTKR